MAALAGPVISRYPAPTRPRRKACRAVITPDTTSETNTAHRSTVSGEPAERNTVIGISMMPDSERIANCSPRPVVKRSGGRSSGS